MLDSLKHAKRNIGRGLSRTWESISEGWHELVHHSSDALTHFTRNKEGEENVRKGGALSTFPVFPSWSLLAGEMEETDKAIVVRVELPGMEKEDCHITIDGNMLYLRGEKRFERATDNSTYHVTERAYGVFQRAIPLPRNVDTDNAEATYKNGVLTINLPKPGGEKGRIIPVA
ncbi:heat shock protein Hsp20 [Nitrosospira sp. Nl5]|uniref:Hsp20/alpha crystallin family protein n=1 Tax=Nitrosospira sp. Nl5 TaxID=200120 RepID=UPI00089097B4|nr:Hsp20/alpha crystallin family protein [Nitrosospira sp. Nl5]SCY72985.1 heat shock protein Hsp20 [Nitrosospira sp. Nl5]